MLFFPFTCTCEDTLPQIRYFTGLVYYILHLNNIEQEMTTNTLPNLSEVLLYSLHYLYQALIYKSIYFVDAGITLDLKHTKIEITKTLIS